MAIKRPFILNVILSPTGDKVFNNTSPFEITITATEEVIGLNLAALEVTNGTAANLQTTDNTTFTVDITPAEEGMVLTDILVGTVTDLASNAPFFTIPIPVIYDITAPEVTLSTTVSSPLAATAIPVTIVFNEKSLLDVAGITVGNGTAANLVTTDILTYTVDITATADGEILIDVLANGATDLAGNGNNPGNQLSVTVDTISPSIAITSSASDPTGSSPNSVIITFSEAISGFDVADITVGNGSVANLQTSDNTVFTVDITPTADGQVTVDVAAAIATDAAGNENTSAIQFSITYDGTAPTVSITSGEANPTSNTTFAITITFSEAISGFDVADITVGNGSVANLQTSDNTIFTVDITPTADGLVTIDIAAAVATDAVGNENIAATQFTITYATILGLEEGSQGDLSIFPNPVQSELQLQLGDNIVFSGKMEVIIASMDGKQVYSKMFRNLSNRTISINLSGQKSGMYLVRVIYGNNVLNYKIRKD